MPKVSQRWIREPYERQADRSEADSQLAKQIVGTQNPDLAKFVVKVCEVASQARQAVFTDWDSHIDKLASLLPSVPRRTLISRLLSDSESTWFEQLTKTR